MVVDVNCDVVDGYSDVAEVDFDVVAVDISVDIDVFVVDIDVVEVAVDFDVFSVDIDVDVVDFVIVVLVVGSLSFSEGKVPHMIATMIPDTTNIPRIIKSIRMDFLGLGFPEQTQEGQQ